MNIAIETALIAGGSGLLGAAAGGLSTWLVARISIKASKDTATATIEANTADVRAQIEGASAGIRTQVEGASADLGAQIEADRRHRIWERQADVYAEAIAGIRHRQRVRHCQWQGMIRGTEPERPPVPVDWPMVEGRLITYSSAAVMTALTAASAAGSQFERDLGSWQFHNELEEELAAVPLESRPPPANPPDYHEDKAEKSLAEANRLDDELMDLIRAELHASALTPPTPPVPLSQHNQDE